MITTLGFSVQAELAHHRQGQSPNLMLVGLFFLHFLELRSQCTPWLVEGQIFTGLTV